MFLVTNRLNINPGHETELEARFARRAGLIEQEPGFVRMTVLRPVEKKRDGQGGDSQPLPTGKLYLVQTWWQSQEAFWAWTKSESFKAAHRDTPPPEMYAGPASLEMHEVVIDSHA